MSKTRRETEDTENFTLIFDDVLYFHRLTIKCEADVYDQYQVGDHLDSRQVLRQSNIDEP